MYRLQVQLGPEDASLLEACVLMSEGVTCMYSLQSNWDQKMCVPIREVSSFQRVLCTGFSGRCERRSLSKHLLSLSWSHLRRGCFSLVRFSRF